MYKTVIIGLLLLALWGCQSLKSPLVKPIIIDYQNRSTLEFTGRGSAAGMMMSGSMGAMGIAIGVAIDEGISKDLHASAAKGGFILEDEIAHMLTKHGYMAINTAAQTIVIRHLGFRASGDLIVPWVEISLATKNDSQSFSYADIAGDERNTFELSELKNNSKVTAKALRDALQLVFDNALLN